MVKHLKDRVLLSRGTFKEVCRGAVPPTLSKLISVSKLKISVGKSMLLLVKLKESLLFQQIGDEHPANNFPLVPLL